MSRLKTIHIVLLGALLFSTAGKLERLSPTERTHFEALKVFMSKADQKTFLKFKEEEDRNRWLKAKQLWDRYYGLDEPTREAVTAGHVQKGWTDEMVFMAWGPPHERRRLAVAEASLSELFVYFVEVSADGSIRLWTPGSKKTHAAVEKYRWELKAYDHKIVAMEKRPGWGG